MIPLFTLVLILIGASELRNIRQTNGQRDVRVISAETASKNFASIRLNNTSGLGPTINLIQSGPKGLAKDDPSPSKSDMNHKRVPRGASVGRDKKGDQQFPFSHRYPKLHDSSDYFTTPHSQRSYPTLSLDRGSSTTRGLHVEGGERNNDSAEKGTTGIHNPLYPVTDSSYSAYAVMLLSLIVFAVGITGNLAVMCIVWHNYYMKSAWNSILASLAFWDFLVLFFCLPVVVFNELTKKRLLGDVSCRIVPYLEVTSLGVTTFSLCALGIDRFHAATSLQPKTRQVEQCQSILAKLAVVWIGSMILAVPELLLWQLTQDASGPTGVVVESCTMRPSPSLPESIFSLVHTYHDARMWWYFGCYFCLPLLFTLSCQLVTRRIGGGATPGLESRPLPSSSSSSSTSSSSPKKLQQEKLEQKRDQQLNCTVVALTTVYAVCGLPENVCNIALAYTSTQVAAPTLALLALINQFFLFFKSSLTPVLLLCLCKSLGQSFMDCCCCCCEECLSDGVSSSASTSSSSPSSACRSAGGKPKSCSSEISPSIFFDKAKDNSSILAIGTPC